MYFGLVHLIRCRSGNDCCCVAFVSKRLLILEHFNCPPPQSSNTMALFYFFFLSLSLQATDDVELFCLICLVSYALMMYKILA